MSKLGAHACLDAHIAKEMDGDGVQRTRAEYAERRWNILPARGSVNGRNAKYLCAGEQREKVCGRWG